MNNVVSKYLEFPNLRMFFHAKESDSDGQGRSIADTYAEKSLVDANDKKHNREEGALRDSMEQSGRQISALEGTVNAFGKEQKMISDIVRTANGQSSSALRATDLLTSKVDALSKKVVPGSKFFMTEDLLRKVMKPAKVGDFAFVARPFTFDGVAFNAEIYYGSYYIGDKTAKSAVWHNMDLSADGFVLSDDDDYYRVESSNFQMLADMDIDTLLEHHHISPIEILVLDEEDELPLNIYSVGEDGEWAQIGFTAGFAVSQTISACNVMDGDDSQEELNLGSEINALRGNMNNDALRQVVNALVDKVNDLQVKVAYVDDPVSSSKVPYLPLVDYQSRGVNESASFDVATFDESVFV